VRFFHVKTPPAGGVENNVMQISADTAAFQERFRVRVALHEIAEELRSGAGVALREDAAAEITPGGGVEDTLFRKA